MPGDPPSFLAAALTSTKATTLQPAKAAALTSSKATALRAARITAAALAPTAAARPLLLRG